MKWTLAQPSVAKDRIALIGGSTGSHPAFPHIAAMVGISPVIAPRAFGFPQGMAEHFAAMLTGVTGRDLLEQWNALTSLSDPPHAFAPRPILLVAAETDDIFPPSDYAESIAGMPNIELIRNKAADHGFSSYRPWLVRTVTDWLSARLGV